MPLTAYLSFLIQLLHTSEYKLMINDLHCRAIRHSICFFPDESESEPITIVNKSTLVSFVSIEYKFKVWTSSLEFFYKSLYISVRYIFKFSCN